MPTVRSDRPADRVDLAVVGAGPAGLNAAVIAADGGCRVALLDLGDRIGGQYYRHGPEVPPGGASTGRPHGWVRFERLRRRLAGHQASGRVIHLPRTAVWSVTGTGPFEIRALEGERQRAPRTVLARGVVVATGAHDRHVPFPGWTLPGVVAVGGAQAVLKADAVAVGSRVVVAGTGPFLLSVADGLLAAGVDVVAVVEANDPRRYAREPLAVAGALAKVPEALGYGVRLARHRVPYLVRCAVTEARGDGAVRQVVVRRLDEQWHPIGGTERVLDCDTLAVGYGFSAQLDLLAPLGCRVVPGPDGGPAVEVDQAQATSVPGVWSAGETTGIGGVDLATAEGALAGAAAATALTGAAPLDRRALEALRRRRARLRRFAAALHRVHPVRDGWADWVDDDTVVCRCEEATVGDVRNAVALGARDARTVKALARPGMGWCQGRICTPATAALTARLCGSPVSAEALAASAGREPAQPVPLAVLADLPDRPRPPE